MLNNSKKVSTPEKKQVPENNFSVNEILLLTIEVDKNLMLRVIDNVYGRFVDIRKFYKGFPTKNGVKIPLSLFDKIYYIIKEKTKDK